MINGIETPKKRRGFAAMSVEKQREIARKGGRAAHEKGTAHEFTADEARIAGRKGGVAVANMPGSGVLEARALLGFLPSLLALVQLASIGPTLLIALSLGVIQFSLGTVLEPRLMGRTLNLSPVVIVLSLAVWGGLWGVVGMFLCVPIMVMLTIAGGQIPATRPFAILLTADGRTDPGAG